MIITTQVHQCGQSKSENIIKMVRTRQIVAYIIGD